MLDYYVVCRRDSHVKLMANYEGIGIDDDQARLCCQVWAFVAENPSVSWVSKLSSDVVARLNSFIDILGNERRDRYLARVSGTRQTSRARSTSPKPYPEDWLVDAPQARTQALTANLYLLSLDLDSHAGLQPPTLRPTIPSTGGSGQAPIAPTTPTNRTFQPTQERSHVPLNSSPPHSPNLPISPGGPPHESPLLEYPSQGTPVVNLPSPLHYGKLPVITEEPDSSPDPLAAPSFDHLPRKVLYRPSGGFLSKRRSLPELVKRTTSAERQHQPSVDEPVDSRSTSASRLDAQNSPDSPAESHEPTRHSSPHPLSDADETVRLETPVRQPRTPVQDLKPQIIRFGRLVDQSQTSQELSPLASSSQAFRLEDVSPFVERTLKSIEERDLDSLVDKLCNQHRLPPLDRRLQTLSPTPQPSSDDGSLESASESSSSLQLSPHQSSEPSLPRVSSPEADSGVNMASPPDPDSVRRAAEMGAALSAALTQGPIGDLIRDFANNQNSKKSIHGWKIQNIGYFHPNLDPSYGVGDSATIGADVHWRDVFLFEEAVREAAKNPSKKEIILSNFPQLFRGDAQLWYTGQVDLTTKQVMHTNLDLALSKVVEKFRPDAADALKYLFSQDSQFTEESYRKGLSIQSWSMGIIRACKAAGLDLPIQHMLQIWNSLYPNLRALVVKPGAGLKLDEFLQHLEEKAHTHRETVPGAPDSHINSFLPKPMSLNQMLIAGVNPTNTQGQKLLTAAFANLADQAFTGEQVADSGVSEQATHSYWARTGQAGGSSTQPAGSDDSRGGAYRVDSTRGRGGYRGSYRGYNRRFQRPFAGGDRGNRYQGYQRGRGGRGRGFRFRRSFQPYRRRWQKWVKPKKNGESWQGIEDECFLAADDPQLEDHAKELRDEGYLMIEEYDSEGEEEVYVEEESENVTESAYFVSPPTREIVPDTKSHLAAHKRHLKKRSKEALKTLTCSHCSQHFDSRSEFFLHNITQQCQRNGPVVVDVSDSPAAPISQCRTEDNEAFMADDVFDSILAKPLRLSPAGAILSKYTYCMLPAHLGDANRMTTVCLDTGCSNVLVSRSWLRDFVASPVLSRHPGIRVKGVGGKILLEEKASFSLYIPGTTFGQAKTGILDVCAWITEDLGPNLLVGNEFLYEHGFVVDYPRMTSRITSCQNLEVPIQVHRKKPIARRRVVAREDITIPAKSMLHVPVSYADLPAADDGESPRDFCFTATVDGALGSVTNCEAEKVVAFVNTADVPKKIRRKTKMGFLQDYDYDGYLTTLWEKASMAQTAAALNDEDCGDAEDSSEPAFWLSAEFDLSEDMINAFASEEATPEDIWKATRGHRGGPDETPPTFGVSKPVNMPEIETKHGVHVCNNEPALAARIKDLAESFSLWEKKGILDLPDDEKMRIDLVDGWQHQIRPCRPYPLGLEDQAVVDETLQPMRAEKKLEDMNFPTPMACPLFVVWKTSQASEAEFLRQDGNTTKDRIIRDKDGNYIRRKGRMVIDLRPVNKIAVPDSYPLPSQDDMINRLLAKRYLSVADASSFFHQLPVWPGHRNRMVIISPRGLEVSNVVLMGFCNSPGHSQRFMDRHLRPFKDFADAFIDDVIVASDTAEEHVEHLAKVLGMFDDLGLALSAKKSFLGYPAVVLLGFLVDGLGMSITEDRLLALRKLECPTDLGALEKYIGMTGFLRKFVPWYQQKLAPLQLRKTTMLAEGRTTQTIPSKVTQRRQWTSKRRFEPTESERRSFDIIQEDLSRSSYLVHWSPSRTVFVKLDAARERGFGAMVFHCRGNWDGQHIPIESIEPVMFLSKVLTKAEKRYYATELEVACLVWVCRSLRIRFQSSVFPIVILTDHRATRGIVEQTNLKSQDLVKLNPKLLTASTYLSQFRLDVRYIPGRVNLVPDALSRLPTIDTPEDLQEAAEETKNQLEDILDDFGYAGDDSPVRDSTRDDYGFTATTEISIDPAFRKRLINGYALDEKMSKIIAQLQGRELKNLSNRNFRFQLDKEGLLFNTDNMGGRRLCIPDPCVQEIFEMVHDKKHHFGIARMAHDLTHVAIPGLSRKLLAYTKHCPSCLENSTNRQKKLGEARPVESPPQPFHTVAWDFFVALKKIPSKDSMWRVPGYEEFDAGLAMTCKFSKRGIIIPGHTTYTAEIWSGLILRALQLFDWGLPYKVISDRDPKFVSEIWQAIFLRSGTQLAMSTAYNPQTDGLSERRIQDIEIAIRYHMTASDIPWDQILPALQHNFNNSKHSVLGRSPNEIVYGFKPRSPLSVLEVPKLSIDYEIHRKLYQKEAQLAIDFAAADAKIRYDSKRNPLQMQVGQEVYLKLHHGYHLPGKPSRKFSQQRAGPFTIVKKIGDLAYELNFPRHWRVHRVVSVSHLYPAPLVKDPWKRRRPQPGRVFVDGDNGEWISYEIERMVARRISRVGGKPTLEYLVRWKDYDPKDDEWYPRLALMENAAELVDDFDKKNPLPVNELKLKREGADLLSGSAPPDLDKQSAPASQHDDTRDPADWKVVDVIPKSNIEVRLPKLPPLALKEYAETS